MPSVGFIATARTRFSPRCCSTFGDDINLLRAAGAVRDDADGV
jgi:hypothetical protein